MLEMTLIGVDPDMKNINNKHLICQIPTMPYDEYRSFMEDNDFDIGQASLIDTPFSNKNTSINFEYSKNGILGIYSNHLPYTLVIKNMVNGILVENSVDSWYNAICNAIENIEKMKGIVERAQGQLREAFSIDAIREKVYSEIDSIILSRNNHQPILYSHPVSPE